MSFTIPAAQVTTLLAAADELAAEGPLPRRRASLSDAVFMALQHVERGIERSQLPQAAILSEPAPGCQHPRDAWCVLGTENFKQLVRASTRLERQPLSRAARDDLAGLLRGALAAGAWISDETYGQIRRRAVAERAVLTWPLQLDAAGAHVSSAEEHDDTAEQDQVPERPSSR